MRTWLLAVSIGMGCGVAAEPNEEDLDETVAITTPIEVARVTTPDGTLWRFIEAEPTELLVWSTQTIGDTTTPPPPNRNVAQMRPIDIYRSITSAPVPKALLDAQARADVAEPAEPGDDSDADNDAGGWARDVVVPRISATSFQNNYCWAGTFYYCWPSLNGNPWVQHKSLSMTGHVAAVNNNVRFRWRYKKHSTSSWTVVFDVQALAGQVHFVSGSYSGYRRLRRFEVLDNGANLVRYSASGFD